MDGEGQDVVGASSLGRLADRGDSPGAGAAEDGGGHCGCRHNLRRGRGDGRSLRGAGSGRVDEHQGEGGGRRDGLASRDGERERAGNVPRGSAAEDGRIGATDGDLLVGGGGRASQVGDGDDPARRQSGGRLQGEGERVEAAVGGGALAGGLHGPGAGGGQDEAGHGLHSHVGGGDGRGHGDLTGRLVAEDERDRDGRKSIDGEGGELEGAINVPVSGALDGGGGAGDGQRGGGGRRRASQASDGDHGRGSESDGGLEGDSEGVVGRGSLDRLGHGQGLPVTTTSTEDGDGEGGGGNLLGARRERDGGEHSSLGGRLVGQGHGEHGGGRRHELLAGGEHQSAGGHGPVRRLAELGRVGAADREVGARRGVSRGAAGEAGDGEDLAGGKVHAGLHGEGQRVGGGSGDGAVSGGHGGPGGGASEDSTEGLGHHDLRRGADGGDNGSLSSHGVGESDLELSSGGGEHGRAEGEHKSARGLGPGARAADLGAVSASDSEGLGGAHVRGLASREAGDGNLLARRQVDAGLEGEGQGVGGVVDAAGLRDGGDGPVTARAQDGVAKGGRGDVRGSRGDESRELALDLGGRVLQVEGNHHVGAGAHGSADRQGQSALRLLPHTGAAEGVGSIGDLERSGGRRVSGAGPLEVADGDDRGGLELHSGLEGEGQEVVHSGGGGGLRDDHGAPGARAAQGLGGQGGGGDGGVGRHSHGLGRDGGARVDEVDRDHDVRGLGHGLASVDGELERAGVDPGASALEDGRAGAADGEGGAVRGARAGETRQGHDLAGTDRH
mmetsp:Transcript_111/g.350  ORF Transcript_111/g.350 Transcript_111/m.350 type:complete len:785 (-) Transcript_111:691-3045(-)